MGRIPGLDKDVRTSYKKGLSTTCRVTTKDSCLLTDNTFHLHSVPYLGGVDEEVFEVVGDWEIQVLYRESL